MNYGLLVVLLFPVVAGVIGFYLGKKNKATRNDWIDIAMFLQVIILVCMGYELWKGWEHMDLPLANVFGVGLFLYMDPIRLILCGAVTIIYGVVTQFMKESLKEEKSSNRYYLLYMASLGMVLGACMTINLFDFLIFGLAAFILLYPLVIHRMDAQVLKQGRFYIAFLMISMVFIFLGDVLVLKSLDAVGFVGAYVSLLNGAGGILNSVAGVFLLLGFGIWAGLCPMPFVVTKGSASGVIETSTILNTVLSKVGELGVVMVGVSLFPGDKIFSKLVLVIGIATIIWGLILSILFTDVRKILMGLNVTLNGITTLAAFVMIQSGASNAYAIRAAFYMLVTFALSQLVLYMVVLEQVRKIHTFEIKGLIASGKTQPILAVATFLAGCSIIGVPGTTGYLAHSMLVKSILTLYGFEWLIVVYVLQWAFLFMAVARIFMKLFVSKVDERVRILSTEQEFEDQNEKEENDKPEKTEVGPANPYGFGEKLLVLIGLCQMIPGILPHLTVDRLAESINTYFLGSEVLGNISYYTVDALVVFVIAVGLGLLLYVNLVHGILLRSTRNKKNKKLKKEQEKIENN